jgi:hypothetical protein
MTEPQTLAEWVATHADEIAKWAPSGAANPCQVPRCPRDSLALGLCKLHWLKAKQHFRRSRVK